jgi:hypothetical protein
MRSFSFLGLAPFFSAALAGGQFPAVDGIVGGVPQNNEAKFAFAAVGLESKLNSTMPTGITPGKLRYVENSGVCGMCE